MAVSYPFQPVKAHASSISITPPNSHRSGEGDSVGLAFSLEAHGFGAVLATNEEPDATIQKLMGVMKSLTAEPLSSFSNAWKTLPQTAVQIEPTKGGGDLQGMVKISGGDYVFRVEGIGIEASTGSAPMTSIRGRTCRGDSMSIV